MMLFSEILKAGFFVVWRKGAYFEGDNTYNEMAVAFDAASIVFGTVLIVLSLAVLKGYTGHRLPLVVVASGMVSYVVTHAFGLGFRTLLLDHEYLNDNGPWAIGVLNLAYCAFSGFTDLLVLLATFLVLWNRQSSLASAHLAKKPNFIKRVFDIAVIATSLLISAARWGLLASLEQQWIMDFNRRKQFQVLMLKLANAYILLSLIAVLNLAFTAALLRSKFTLSGIKDKATNSVLFVVVPSMLLPQLSCLLLKNSHPLSMHGLVVLAECVIVPAFVALILVRLCAKGAVSGSLGNGSAAFNAAQAPSLYELKMQQQMEYAQMRSEK